MINESGEWLLPIMIAVITFIVQFMMIHDHDDDSFLPGLLWSPQASLSFTSLFCTFWDQDEDHVGEAEGDDVDGEDEGDGVDGGGYWGERGFEN